MQSTFVTERKMWKLLAMPSVETVSCIYLFASLLMLCRLAFWFVEHFTSLWHWTHSFKKQFVSSSTGEKNNSAITYVWYLLWNFIIHFKHCILWKWCIERLSRLPLPSNVHLCQQKSVGLKFSKSQIGSDVRYSCHHNSSRFTFPIFALAWES